MNMPRTLSSVSLAAALLWTAGASPAQETVELARRPVDIGGRQMRLFDLRDLLAAMESATPAEDAEPVDRDTLLASRRERIARIASACATFIDPPLCDEETVQGVGSTHLACMGTATQQQWVTDFLELQRQSPTTLLSLEARIWRVSPEVYATLALDDGPRALGEAELARLTTRLMEAGTDILMAPRVTVAGLSEFSIETAESFSYLSDYALETVGEGEDLTRIANPMIDVVKDGLELCGLLARLGKDRIGLQCTFALSEVERPFPVVEVTLIEGTAPVTIQKPTVHRIAVDATAVAKHRHAILFPAPEFRGTHPVVVLMPSLVEVAEDR